MSLKIGLITKDMKFIYLIKNELKSMTNIEITSFDQRKDHDFILLDYDSAKDIYESLIAARRLKNVKLIIISKQALLSYIQPDDSITPMILHPNKISSKLVNILESASSCDYIIIKSQRSEYKLRYYDILMVYPENHYLNFVLVNETIKSRIPVNKISELLESHGFAVAKSSTYVNIHRIRSITKHKVILDSGKHTSISRYKYKALIKKFKEEV